jgi:DNA-directed RNA polymerase beta subunit
MIGNEMVTDKCYRRVYDGNTGMWFNTMMFVAPCFSIRLPKYPVDEIYDNDRSRLDINTHQPIDGGKARRGGLRLGEMEKDVMMLSGNMKLVYQKYYKDSCGVSVIICANCRQIMSVNEKEKLYRCRCGNNARPHTVQGNWPSILVNRKLRSANIDIKFNLGPTTFIQ